MLSRLQHQQETLKELVADFTEEQLRRRVDPEKWSAFENLAHLAVYQPVFLTRIERIGKEKDPRFERYVAEQDALFPISLERGMTDLLREIMQDRALIIARLTALDDNDLRRTGLHPRYGPLTLRQWTEFFLLHEAHHLFTIFKLLQDILYIT